MSPGEEDAKPSARSDLAQAVFWLGAGGALFYASWTMDRLANLGVQPFSAPGLLPGVLGVFIVVLGFTMLVRAMRALRKRAANPPATPAIEWRRIALPLALCLGFAAGMVGRGIAFWLAAWIFVSLTVWTLQYRERHARNELGRLALVALAVGAGASVAITLIFQELFLIRLP